MSRRGGAGRVVPVGTAVSRAWEAKRTWQQAHAYHSNRQDRAGERGSSSAWAGTATARGQTQQQRAGGRQELHATMHASDGAREPCNLRTCEITTGVRGPAVAELIDGIKPKGRAADAGI
jgi:hypothetical protein